MANTRIETIVASKKEPILPQVFKGKVNHIIFVVTSRNIHINIGRVFKYLTGILPINPSTDMRKLEHCFRVSFRYIHKVLRQGYILRFVRIWLYSCIAYW